MSKGLLFWVVYLLVVILGLYWGYSSGGWAFFGGGFVLFVLIGLLGWGVFGPPVR